LKGSILFSFGISKRKEGEDLSRRPLRGRRTGVEAFTPTVILFIALPATEDKFDPG